MAVYGPVISKFAVIRNGSDTNILFPIIAAEQEYPLRIWGISIAGGDVSEYVRLFVCPPGTQKGIAVDGRTNSVCVGSGGPAFAGNGANTAPQNLIGSRDAPTQITVPAGYNLMWSQHTANTANWNLTVVAQSIIG